MSGRGKKSSASSAVAAVPSAAELPSSSEASSVVDVGVATPSTLRDSSSVGVSLQSSATPPVALRSCAADGGATDTSQGRPSTVALAEAGPSSCSDTDASLEGGCSSTAGASLNTPTSRRSRQAASSGASGSLSRASAPQLATSASGAAATTAVKAAEPSADTWPATEDMLRTALRWLQNADGLIPPAPTASTHAAPAGTQYLSVHKVAALLAGEAHIRWVCGYAPDVQVLLRLPTVVAVSLQAPFVADSGRNFDHIVSCEVMRSLPSPGWLTMCSLVVAAVAPPTLQAEVVSLVPRLVAPAEHTQAAGALLGRLAEASRQGPGSEAGLRLPVLAALGRLRIDPAVADRVLHAALAVCACRHQNKAEIHPHHVCQCRSRWLIGFQLFADSCAHVFHYMTRSKMPSHS